MVNNNDEMMGSRSISGGISKKAEMVVVEPYGYALSMDMSKGLFMSEYVGLLIQQLEEGLWLYNEIYSSRDECNFSNYLITMHSDECEHIRYLYDTINNSYGYSCEVAEILQDAAKVIGSLSADTLCKNTELLSLIICNKVEKFLERMPEDEDNDSEKAA